MAERFSRARGAGFVATGAAIALAAVVTMPAGAQQAKQPAKQPAKQAAPAGAQQQSAWVKLCEKAPYNKMGPDGKPQLADGKPVMEEKMLCLTHHEQMTNVGVTMISAAIQQLDGIDKLHMMVMVPPTTGIVMPAGMSVVVYDKEQVAKLEKKEQLDQKTLVGQKLMFTICHQNGCTAENEATPQLVEAMKKGVVMVAYATHVSGQPIPYQVPLVGFKGTLEGKAVDNQAYQEQRKNLQQTFMANRLEALKQMQGGGQAAAGAPAAGGPAAKAPAKK